MHYKMSVFLKGWVSSPVFSIAWKVKRQSYNNLSNRIVLLVVSALLHLKLLMCVCGRGWPGLKWLEANINCSNPYFASLVAMVTWDQSSFSFHLANAIPAGNEAILTRPRKTASCRRVDKVGPGLRLMIWLCFFSLQNEWCFILPSGWN